MTCNPVTTIAFCNFYEELNRDNRLFEQCDAAIGDDLLLPFSELRSIAAQRGIMVATTAVLPAEVIDAYVFIDKPAPDSSLFRSALASSRPLYLIVMESRLVHPQNYDADLQRHFKKIFTYDDSLVDGKRFIKLNYAFRLPTSIPRDFASKEKLCVMIAGYKLSRKPLELYGERLAVIRWFERHHPEDFDLYGIGWDEIRIPGVPLVRHLNKVNWLKRLLAPNFPSWLGPVQRKRDVMGRYRFAFCYENVKDMPGYITEKLFDAFFAGTVPVYWGADNVTNHIPAGCFVDRRRFASHEELYLFMKEMTESEYLEYLNNIESFINSDHSYPFTTDFFAETIVNGILNE